MTISQQDINKRLDYFRQTVKSKGLPLTPQKLEIFRIIASSCSHPQAPEIYEQVKKNFENISLATVYKNLIQFQDLGLVTEITLPSAPSRYDAKLDTHSHAVDTATGQVYDLEINSKWNLPKKIMGKKVKKTVVIYYL
ncbi:MAG: transcriptional repressor [Patescibacteria group bacterium]